MRRALILIISLSLLSFGSGYALDHLRQRTAEQYLAHTEEVRQLALAARWQEAQAQARLIYARWQQDERWLKCLISHHHTRAVEAGFLRLDTALANRWADEALPAADDLYLALVEIRDDHMARLENVL